MSTNAFISLPRPSVSTSQILHPLHNQRCASFFNEISKDRQFPHPPLACQSQHSRLLSPAAFHFKFKM